MSDALIRRAGPEDAETLSALGAQTFSETFGHLYPPSDLATFLREAYGLPRTRADLADPAKAAWLVEVGGRPVGYAQAGPCALPHDEVTDGCGELKRIYFLKGWQGGGLGKRLFSETMAWLLADGPRNVWIGVWSENYGAQRFYARQGFQKVGEYGFHVGRTVDAEFILRRNAEDFATILP
ncbi:GNAT family N-acetyltransferase [Phenylobacterium sp. J426]|uniref:GNAT family N-acetyltransferase n=1 Tax=Phenylobacterium sp. J426 TaxID=2898439 RepID=UPI00215198FC|nr:GNAT family N-acetyltransferase [Phenylobacterium sp. J426]MCR5874896.1 GNAT family N-acetyltransferase [Phenylobacterium sp. J426]